MKLEDAQREYQELAIAELEKPRSMRNGQGCARHATFYLPQAALEWLERCMHRLAWPAGHHFAKASIEKARRGRRYSAMVSYALDQAARHQANPQG